MDALKKVITAQYPTTRRPYWHVDAKWVSGLLLAFMLFVWLLMIAAWQITNRETAIPLMANLITLGMKEGDAASNQKTLEEWRQRITQSPTKSIQPIAGFPATVTEADLQLGADGLRDKIFRQVVTPLYEKGARKLAEEQTSDKAQQDKFVNSASTLSLITSESHNRIGIVALVWGITTVLVGGLAVMFSYRLGKLVTPAIVLLLVSMPGMVIFTLFSLVISTQPVAPAAEAQNYLDLALAAKGQFAPAVDAARQVYLVAVLVSIGLLALALVGRLFLANKKTG